MKKIQFNDSELLYPVGLGTWQMGEIIPINKMNLTQFFMQLILVFNLLILLKCMVMVKLNYY